MSVTAVPVMFDNVELEVIKLFPLKYAEFIPPCAVLTADGFYVKTLDGFYVCPAPP